MRFDRKTIIILAVNVLLLAAFAVSIACCAHYADLLPAQQVAERWQGVSEVRFAQVTAFRPVGKELTQNDVLQFRESAKAALTDAAFDLDEGMTLFLDAYSARSFRTVTGRRGAIEATAYAVGGDFFTFHPLNLVSGSYIKESDFARDGIVVTRELAWALFGAVDVTGLSVTIGDASYMIVGVVDTEDDAASKAANAGGLCFYAHSDAFYAPSDKFIDCYEAVIADPISDFAVDVVEQKLPKDGEIVENSARFRADRVVKLITEYGRRSMNVSAVVFPYWENAARYAEDHMALWMAAAAVTALFPLVCMGIIIVRAVRGVKAQGKRVAKRLRDRY